MRVCSRLNTEGLVLLALVSFQSHFCACIHRGHHAGLQKQRQLAITLCFSQSPKIIHNSSDSSCFSRWASRCPTFRLQREKRSTKFLSLQRRVQLRYSLGYEFIHYLFLSLSRASFISGFFIRGGFISGYFIRGGFISECFTRGGFFIRGFQRAGAAPLRPAAILGLPSPHGARPPRGAAGDVTQARRACPPSQPITAERFQPRPRLPLPLRLASHVEGVAWGGGLFPSTANGLRAGGWHRVSAARAPHSASAAGGAPRANGRAGRGRAGPRSYRRGEAAAG